MADRLTVQCPTCAQPAEYSARNPWRPFCSDRCRGIDLGAWASERFRLASRPEPGDAEDVAPPPAQAIPTTRRG